MGVFVHDNFRRVIIDILAVSDGLIHDRRCSLVVEMLVVLVCDYH